MVKERPIKHVQTAPHVKLSEDIILEMKAEEEDKREEEEPIYNDKEGSSVTSYHE